MYNFLKRHSVIRNALGTMVVLSLLIAVAPVDVQAAPVVIVAAVVAVTAAGVVIYDFNSCGINWIWGCGGRGGDDDDDKDDDEDDDDDECDKEEDDEECEEEDDDDRDTAPLPVRCNNSTPNACGMSEIRYAIPGQECNITPISNNRCPAPEIGDAGFYADPDRVRAGNSTTLFWNVTDATMCTLTGGGLSLSSLGLVGEQDTDTIEAATAFTLTCSNGDAVDSPQTSEETVVNLIPSFQEI